MTALLRSSTPVRFLMHPNLIGERSPRWLAHFRLTNPVNGHDLGNHCPTPAVTSAVLTSNSNCLPQLTLSRPQINALMPNSVSAVGGLSPLGVGWFSQPIPTIIYPYFLFQAKAWVIGSPFGMLGGRHESTSAAASTLLRVASW